MRLSFLGFEVIVILSSIGALLLSVAILLAGGGLLSTLVAVRAQVEGFSLAFIGLLLSGYYIGFVAGCFVAPYFVARVGHIRAFGALAATAAAVSLIHAISLNEYVWLLLRVVAGFCFSGLYMIVESWINEKSDNEQRGKVLSVYRIVDLVAVTSGQFMLTLSSPETFIPFSMVSVLIALSIVPIALTKSIAPEPISKTALNLRKLIRVSPFAVMGALAVGLANGAFWGISPVLVKQLGYGVNEVALFMSVAIVGGALAQWPVGYISDLIDRRWVLIMVAGASAGGGMFLWMFGSQSIGMLLLGGALYGLFAMPLFGLSAAHANDYAQADEFVAVSGGLLLLYGIGSIIGPAIAPYFMTLISPSAMFAYTALIHSALLVFGLYRLTRRDSIALEDQEDYVAVPRTSPGVFEMDPRSSNDGVEAAEEYAI